MARFDRQDKGGDSLTASLGNATEELRSTLERQIGEIVNAANERAAEIELEASDRAEKIEQDAAQKARDAELEAERRAAAIKEKETQQLTRLLERVNALGDAIFRMLDDMRTELQAALDDHTGDVLVEEQRPEAEPAQDLTQREQPAPEPIAQEQQPPPEPAIPEQQVNGQPAPEEAADQHTADQHPADQLTQERFAPAPEVAPQRASELDQMLREQLTTMFREGKSRSEAAQFLMRFNLGKSYLGLIDEVYWSTSEPDKPVSRQRFARRLRHRQR